MTIVLKELDKEKFSINVISWLDSYYLIEGCTTNFKDVVIDTLIQMISDIVERDEWNLQYFEKDELEKLFNAFMENSKIIVRLNKKIDELNYDFEEITIEFDFLEDEKKKIAEIYLQNVLNYRSFFEECIIGDFEEKDIDIISEFLSDEVYQLLSPDEIKAKFRDKLEKIINDN